MFKNIEFKKIRIKKKFSQKYLANLIGKSLRTLQRWENGSVIPAKSDILMLAKILNVSPEEISEINSSLIQHVKVFQNLDSLDRSTIDFSSKTDIEKQQQLLDLQTNNTFLLWENKEQSIIVNNLNIIFNSLSYPVYQKNEYLKYNYVNKRFLSFFNFEIEKKIKGLRNTDILQTNWVELDELEKQVLNTREMIKDKIILVPQYINKEINEIAISIKPFFSNKRRLIGIVGSFKNITDFNLMKEKLLFIETALNNSKNVIIISKLTPYRHVVYVNDTFEKIFQMKKYELYSNPKCWLELIDEKEKNKVKKNLEKENIEFSVTLCYTNQNKKMNFSKRTEIVNTDRVEFINFREN